MSQRPVPIREQTRAVVRSLIAKTALGLFAEHGYDATTIDEVAAAAGVSRRTLFNYFRSKEDLALGGLTEQGDVIAARFAARPSTESVWASLRDAFATLDEIETTLHYRLEFMRLIHGSDALRAGQAEKEWYWQQLLAPLIAERLPSDPLRMLRAQSIAATAIACLHAAMDEWLRRDGDRALLAIWDDAVEAVRS